jgi:hypothetical protein
MIDPVTNALAVESKEELRQYLMTLAYRARTGLTPVENEESSDLI